MVFLDVRSVEAAERALEFFRRHFADRRGVGIEMSPRAVGLLMDPRELAASCALLASDLLHALGR